MTPCAGLRILFRAPAGARRGFGHLARCRSLARVLGVRPLVSLRGRAAVQETALALGCDVVRGGRVQLLESLAPDVLVVDDPVTANARRWIAAGRRAGCLVVSVHDASLGCLDADLVIDGGALLDESASRGTPRAGRGPVMPDPAPLDEQNPRDPYAVLVTVGGGLRFGLALEIAEAIVDADPRTTVRLAGGFLSAPQGGERINGVDIARTLRHEMTKATEGGGGGVPPYEACTAGTAATGVPVVADQRPTVAAFVARGAAGGSACGPVSAADAAEECVSFLSDAAMRRLSAAGTRLIDERGAARVAAALAQLAEIALWR